MTVGQERSFAEELAGVNQRVQLLILVSDCVRRDQGLKTARINVIDERNFLILQVHCQHIIEDIEAGRTVTRQLDDDLLLLCPFRKRSQLQLPFIRVVKEHVRRIVDILNIYEIILILFCCENLLPDAIALQSQTLFELYTLSHHLVISEAHLHLATSEPALLLLRSKVHDGGGIAAAVLKSCQKLRKRFV